jgi:hypothetical protein
MANGMPSSSSALRNSTPTARHATHDHLGVRDALLEIGPLTQRSLLAGTSFANPTAPKLSPDWIGEVPLLLHEGLAETALQVLDHEGLQLTLAEARVRDALVKFSMHQSAHTMAARALLEDVADLFDAAEIRFTLIKGFATARVYPSGWYRPYSDLDVLVDPQDFPRAVHLAQDRGWYIPARARAQWDVFYLRCREGLNLHRQPYGNLDIHHHVPPWVFGRNITPTAVHARAEVSLVNGRNISLASIPDLLLISALHITSDLSRGRLGLRSWRDVLVLSDRLDPETILATFANANLLWLLRIVADVVQHFSATANSIPSPDSPGVDRMRTRNSLFRLRQLGWFSKSTLSNTDFACTARLPFLAACLYLLGSACPSPKYVAQTDQSYTRYWRRTFVHTWATIRSPTPQAANAEDKHV